VEAIRYGSVTDWWNQETIVNSTSKIIGQKFNDKTLGKQQVNYMASPEYDGLQMKTYFYCIRTSISDKYKKFIIESL
jgi:hypothetical protein